MAEIGRDPRVAKGYLDAGLPVAIPTETVYGLGANALDEQALLRIFEAKQRPFFDPLIVHIHGISEVSTYAAEFPDQARQLAMACWPGPLTIILPKRSIVPDLATAGHPTVALRVPDHPLTLELLRSLDYPLAAPSANPFGYISPTLPAHVQEQLGYRIPYILDGGPCRVGLESTIVSFAGGSPMLLRLGGMDPVKLKSILGELPEKLHTHSDPDAPGQMDRHYAPGTGFMIEDNLEDQLGALSGKRVALIRFSAHSMKKVAVEFLLSPAGNTAEAALNLFRMLREADAGGFDAIIAELVPDEGLGRAVNDRLRRAAHR